MEETTQQVLDAAAGPSIGRRLRRRAGRVGAMCAAVYAAWFGGVAYMQTDMLFPRWMTGAPMAAAPRGAEQIWLTTPEGHRVEALFFPGRGRSADDPGPAVIYAHGNGELIDQCTDIAAMYQARGVSVLLPEYRGYGRSEGIPSQRGIVADFLAFHDLLAARPEVDAGAIVLHGRSLGGGVVAQLAAARPPRALVLEITFRSVSSFAWRYGLPPVAVRHPFRTDRVLAGLEGVPVLIMHGRTDTIVPVSHGRALHQIAHGSVYYETDDDHLSFPRDRREYERVLCEFLGIE